MNSVTQRIGRAVDDLKSHGVAKRRNSPVGISRRSRLANGPLAAKALQLVRIDDEPLVLADLVVQRPALRV